MPEEMEVHTAVLGLERRIAGLWGYPFPWGPMTYVQAAATIGAELILIVVSVTAAKAGLMLPIWAWPMTYIGLPWLAGRLVSRSAEQTDYKRPHEWLWTLVMFRFQPRTLVGFRPAGDMRSQRFTVMAWMPGAGRREPEPSRPRREPVRSAPVPAEVVLAGQWASGKTATGAAVATTRPAQAAPALVIAPVLYEPRRLAPEAAMRPEAATTGQPDAGRAAAFKSPVDGNSYYLRAAQARRLYATPPVDSAWTRTRALVAVTVWSLVGAFTVVGVVVSAWGAWFR